MGEIPWTEGNDDMMQILGLNGEVGRSAIASSMCRCAEEETRSCLRMVLNFDGEVQMEKDGPKHCER